MRALFTLLLIYFLTGILQVTEDTTFAKKDIGFNFEPDTTEIDCTVSAEIDLFESLLENLEDQDNKESFCYFHKITSAQFQQNQYYQNYTAENHPGKNVLVLHTNLPPPLT
ncbi:MAG TPA: hypothetical protein VEP89_12440 [Draconibacterium sp.]|nr:hypothetical protein [Draconibacterium sp.]